MSRILSFVVALALSSAALALSSAALAAEETSPADADRAAIRQTIQSYADAFNRGDVEALVTHWSEEGDYRNPVTGERASGRDAIQKQFAELLADGERAHLTVSVESLRLLGDNVAVEEGTATVRRGAEPPTRSTYVAIHVKRDGKWLLDSVRETSLPADESEVTGLDELAWLVGRWVDRDENATVVTDCEWTANRAFLMRTFHVSIRDRLTMSGTQVIAWDPAARRVRSWVFDSDGGFGEATWTRQGDRWLIRANSTLPDGAKATALQIMTQVDDDHFTWQSIGREVDGQFLPNVEPIMIAREPAANER